MFIHIKALNNSSLGEIQLEVSPSDTIQDLKSRLANQYHIPIQQQKLVLRGKTLHDGSLQDHQIIDGSKLHLMLSPATVSKPAANAFTDELHSLASKWTSNAHEREAFVNTFLLEMKKTVDRLSLDEIERLCTDRLNPLV